MKISNIYNIGQFCPPLSVKTTPIKSDKINGFYKVGNGDVVSFSAKKYDVGCITNPTNHCAYCGCKVYNEQQIDAIAKEFLSSKADRLEGKIRSVIEKLEGAKYSEEIALAKRMENEEELKFFKDLLDAVSKRPFFKGEAIFSQVYNLSRDEAIELLKKNMHPLLRTVDHVSPLNEEKENAHSEINLVEACYCCNHDLKKGVSFNEFYTMFPSIKNNMPADKFQYAMSKLLDSSQANILQRLSASNMLKLVERLFLQRKEAANYLDSIDFRISGCKTGISDSIQSCKDEIAEKEAEISSLEAKYDELLQDPEYKSLLSRIRLNSSLDSEKSAIESLRGRRQRVSDAINELRNTKRSKNKKQETLSKEEKEQRIANLLQSIKSFDEQIASHDDKVLEIEVQIDDLDIEFPTIEFWQQKKNSADNVITSYSHLSRERAALEDKLSQLDDLTAKKDSIGSEIQGYPNEDFKPENYSEEDQALFARYQELLEALKFIEAHPNGGNIKVLIHQSAKAGILKELEAISSLPVVLDYNSDLEKKELQKQFGRLDDQILELNKQINASKKQISHLEQVTGRMTKEDAEKQTAEASEAIRRLTEKMGYLKIPQRITTLNAEITLLQSTIDSLEKKLSEIESVYSSQV